MSIINNPTINNQQVPTLEQKKNQCKMMLTRTAQQSYTSLCRVQKDSVARVWSNPSGLSPQEVCDAAGQDAVQLFTFHEILTQCLVSVATTSGIAPDIALPINAFTKNPDGTVTILDTPYVA